MATMNQMRHIILRALRTGHNVKFLSQPALGKTTMINLVADEMRAKDKDFLFMHFDGGTLAPTDTVMSMPDMQDSTIKQLIDSRLVQACKEGARGMIYVGEWPLMGLEVSKGFQKMVNHEWFGGRRISPGVIFIADGQRLKDRSGTQQQSRAIESRFTTYELAFDTDYALEVIKAHYHTRVATFAIRNPAQIDNYSEVFEGEREQNDLTLQEGKLGIWASLRSWKYVSDKLFDQEKTGEVVLPEEIQRCVGSGVSTIFDTFCRMLDKLATIEDIQKHPDKAPVPEEMSECWAMCTMLALTVNKDTFKPVSVYLNRYKPEHQTAFFRLMNDRLMKAKDGNDSSIRSSDEYKKWIISSHISKLLLGASAK
jgi:hypothetical protein